MHAVTDNRPDRPQGMRKTELHVLCDLIGESGARRVLEIGMANGSSSVAILETLSRTGGEGLTSIDPFQNVPEPAGFGGLGIANVKQAGFAHMHTLIPAADYSALPQLIEQQGKFDFVFIDGYHAFDYTMIDFFYADLLLKQGGILAMHDTAFPAVYKVCQFIMHNKPYAVLGLPPEPMLDRVVSKGLRRLRYALTGQNKVFRRRRLEWCSLAAFRKLGGRQSAEFQLFGL